MGAVVEMSLEKGFGGRFKEGFEMFGYWLIKFSINEFDKNDNNDSNDKNLALTTGSDQIVLLEHEGASMALNVVWARIIQYCLRFMLVNML